MLYMLYVICEGAEPLRLWLQLHYLHLYIAVVVMVMTAMNMMTMMMSFIS